MHEVLKDYANKAIKEFEEYMNGEHSFKEKIEYMIFQEKESYKALPPNLIKELMIEDHEMYSYIQTQYNEKAIPLVIRLINEGKESGEISSKVTTQTALAFIKMFIGQSKELLEMAQQNGNADEFIEGITHMFFFGICGKS